MTGVLLAAVQGCSGAFHLGLPWWDSWDLVGIVEGHLGEMAGADVS